jgi:hypothetical protein
MPSVIGIGKKPAVIDLQAAMDRLGQGFEPGQPLTVESLQMPQVPTFDLERLTQYQKMEQDVSNFAQFPLRYATRNEMINNMMFLAGQFSSYLEQMTAAGQVSCLDDIPVPLEITPHYVCLLVHYTRNSDIKSQISMHGSLRGLAANQNFMDDMSYHIRNYFNDRSGLVNQDTEGLPMFLYEWRLCNRFMEPIPMGNLGAMSLIEVVRATPKRVKEFLRWYKNMDDRTASYPLTATDGEKVVQGIKVKPTKVRTGPLSDKMFKVIGAANVYTADQLFDEHAELADMLWAGYSKYLFNTLTCGLNRILSRKMKLDRVMGITTAFERLVGDFPYFELLDGCEETTVRNLQAMSE